MDNILRDLRVAWRLAMRDPLPSTISALLLALGIGANIALFSVINGVLLRPLPFDPDGRVVHISGLSAPAGHDILEWFRPAQSLESLATVSFGRAHLSSSSGAERILAAEVSGSFFGSFGAHPLTGRLFEHSDDAPDSEPIAVLSTGFWHRAYGSDETVLGKSLVLNGRPFTVVGVAQRQFTYPPGADLWVIRDRDRPRLTLQTDRHTDPSIVPPVGLIGHLATGTGVSTALAELAKRQEEGERADGRSDGDREGSQVGVEPLHEKLVGRTRPALVLLLGAAGFVLLTACANVGHLLLARGVLRGREIAVRTALGATHGRVVRQLLTESALLALVGGVVALIFAQVVLILVRHFAADVVGMPAVTIDGRGLLFALLLSCLTGVLCGMAPALYASTPDVMTALREGTGGGLRGRGQVLASELLVVCEVAATMALLVGAGLMVESFRKARSVDLGFRPTGVLCVELALADYKYQGSEDAARFFTAVIDRVAALPEVEAVGVTSHLPLSEGKGTSLWLDPADGSKGLFVQATLASSQYFRALGIPLRSGRWFEDDDGVAGRQVAIVSQSLAARLPPSSAVGTKVRVASAWREVIGVVGDVRNGGPWDTPRPQVYLPFGQKMGGDRGLSMTLVSRTASDPRRLAAAVRGFVAEVDQDAALTRTRTGEEIVAATLASPRLYAWVLGLFSLVATAVAMTGVYGAMSYAVGQRTREAGIRMALGALPTEIVAMLVRRGLRAVGIGVGLGSLGALGSMRAIRALLYGVAETDAAAYGLAAVILIAVASIALYVSARSILRLDPLAAIRYE